ncbi:condensation domain-containing protein [Micromonospora zhanjiangensis]
MTGPGFVGLGAYRSSAPTEPTILRRALRELVEHHEILRTVLLPTSDGFRHRPGPPGEVPLHVLDVSAPAGRDLEPELLAGVARAPDAPLRAVLGRHPAGCTLVLVANHACADHWSMELLVRDLAAIVDGLTHDRPVRLEVHPFAAAAGDAYHRPATRVELAVRHWRDLLRELPPLVPPVAAPGPMDAESRFVLPVDRTALAAAARTARTTPFVCLLTAYAMALSATAGVDEVAVPLFTSGRERPDWESVGPFMNLVAIRVRIGGLAAPEALSRVHDAFVRALACEQTLARVLPHVPEIGALCRPDGVPAAGFELVQFPPPVPYPASMPLDRLPIGPRYGATVLPLSALLCWLQADGVDDYVGTIRYRSGLVDAGWVADLVRSFARSVSDVTSPRRHLVGPA